jgi:hypothetical protein
MEKNTFVDLMSKAEEEAAAKTAKTKSPTNWLGWGSLALAAVGAGTGFYCLVKKEPKAQD